MKARIYIVMIMATMLLMAACERERRLFPGPAEGQIKAASLPADYMARYENNAYAVSQGKRLFRWFNCNGCHANGGGDIGPPLMDDKWIYGSMPAEIHATIMSGPNGMPPYANHLTEDQAWQIVAYVRSMSGQLRSDVAPSRGDTLNPGAPESRRERLTPRPQNPTLGKQP